MSNRRENDPHRVSSEEPGKREEQLRIRIKQLEARVADLKKFEFMAEHTNESRSQTLAQEAKTKRT